MALAADRAGLGDAYNVREFPAATTLEQAITELLEATGPAPALIRPSEGPLERGLRVLEDEWEIWQQLNDPRGLHAIWPHRIIMQ